MQNFLTSYNPNQDLNQLTEEELQKLKLKELEKFYSSLQIQEDNPEVPQEAINKELESLYSQVDKSIGNPNRKMSMTELQQDPEFQARAERFMDAIGSDENIIEYLRDADYSLSAAGVRAVQSSKWKDQTKEDYFYLRNAFNNADLSGFKEYMGLFKDGFVDLVFDPGNWLAALFTVGTGGTAAGTATAVAAGLKQGVKAAGKAALKRSAPYAKIGAAEGALYGGVHDILTQNTEMNIGALDNFDYGRFALSSGIGTAAGGVLGGGLGVGMSLLRGSKLNRSIDKEHKYVSEINDPEPTVVNPEEVKKNYDADEVVQLEFEFNPTASGTKNFNDTIPRDKDGKIDVTDKNFTEEMANHLLGIKSNADKFAYFLTGKATSRYFDIIGDDTPLMKTFLRKLRYDYDAGVVKDGEMQMVKVKLADGTESEFTIGEYYGRKQGKYLNAMNKIYNPFGLTGWYSRMPKSQEHVLKLLMRDERMSVARVNKRERMEFTFDLPEGQDIRIRNDVLDYSNPKKGFVAKAKFVVGKDAKGNDIIEEVDIGQRTLDVYKQTRLLMNEAFEEGIELKIFAPGTKLKRGFMTRHYRYAALEKDPGDFYRALEEYGHATPMNEIRKADQIKVVVQKLDEKGNPVLDAKGNPIEETVTGHRLGQLGTDEQVFGKDFIKEARRTHPLGSKATEQEIMILAKRKKAEAIVEGMLKMRDNPFEVNNGLGSNFLAPRKFNNIPDNIIDKYLDDNVYDNLQQYFLNYTQYISRKKYFGSSFEEFKAKELNLIISELQETGRFSGTEIKNIAEKLGKTMQRVTGLDTYQDNFFMKNKWGRGGRDVVLASQQASLLPLATLSSITEPLILLSRVPFMYGPEAVKDIGVALGKQTFRSMQQIYRNLERSGRKISKRDDGRITRSSDLVDEEWQELYEAGLAMDQAVMERIEGLTGEGLQSNFARGFQKVFFELNFLAPWTKAVQLASFRTGKKIIMRNSEALATGKSVFGRKLSKTELLQKEKELNSLGIKKNDAINWYKASLVDGKADPLKMKGLDIDNNITNRKQAEFYSRNVVGGATRFTKEVILQPRAIEANRPEWFGNPTAQFFVQFLGYPTVFNNTILTRFIRELLPTSKRTMLTAPRTLGTMMAMTAVAGMGNEIRSGGRSMMNPDGSERSPLEITGNAVRRWGGYGPFDFAARYRSNQENNTGGVASLLKTVSGPFPQDVIDAILYRKGAAEFMSTELPFYGSYDLMFGPGTKKELRKRARALDGKIAKDDKPDLQFYPY